MLKLHDDLTQTQAQLAGALDREGLSEHADELRSATRDEVAAVSRRITAALYDRQPRRLADACAAFELAARHGTQPGLEDIAARNLRNARRFAGLPVPPGVGAAPDRSRD